MRVTLAMSQQKSLKDINKNTEEISRLSSSVASGKNLTKPSEDPTAWAQAMDLKQGLREYDTIKSNMNFVTSWDTTTDSALNQLYDMVTQAKNAAIKAQGVDTAESREALAQTVDGILSQAQKLASTQHGDRYIFSGQTDPSPLTPYTLSAAGVATYNGDSEALTVRTGKGTINNETINLTGPEVFDFTDSTGASANLLEQLWSLKDAITNGNSTTIGTIQDNLDLANQNISKCQTKVGLQLSGITEKQTALTAVTTANKDKLSTIEDTDLAEAITQLQTKQTAFQASLEVTGLLSKLNLSQYL